MPRGLRFWFNRIEVSSLLLVNLFDENLGKPK
jgi:hypothetical protein